MSMQPNRAMVLAAGLGLRMRPLTLTRPKPLVEFAGKTLLDHVLDRLVEARIGEAVVNVHYLPDQIIDHVRARAAPRITISDERDLLLDTGGGVVKALPLLGDAPFIHVNSDTVWSENGTPALRRLVAAFDRERMDMLLLLSAPERSVAFEGKGDFLLDGDGRLVRRPSDAAVAPAYMGAALIDPAIFVDAPSGPFSLNLLFDRAIARSRLFGLLHDGLWMHIGTPEALREAERRLAASAIAGNDAP